ncbi:hypothetical protein Skr01_25190 [Sphaerisporangium krabiense]|uniref:Uncharacterized protein n=1 Tax=Sphaerisporangium krabiense TaxID=763782 RepID=A0A7W9DU06_9ACTN|nr:hypothetical protein [Sphaerisporangium krabiense]MBB5630609.1 hypothetical protein [Sphaerisporangium krabiense]GII62434.1 hypothetical protein Skr01_25190 [Sphaerisporangium krabiense]
MTTSPACDLEQLLEAVGNVLVTLKVGLVHDIAPDGVLDMFGFQKSVIWSLIRSSDAAAVDR